MEDRDLQTHICAPSPSRDSAFTSGCSEAALCTRQEANNLNPAELWTAYMAVGRGGDCCSWLHLRFLPVTFIKLGSSRPGENPSISFWEKLRKNWLLGPRRRVYLEGTQDPSNIILTSSAVVHGPAGNIQTKVAPEF